MTNGTPRHLAAGRCRGVSQKPDPGAAVKRSRCSRSAESASRYRVVVTRANLVAAVTLLVLAVGCAHARVPSADEASVMTMERTRLRHHGLLNPHFKTISRGDVIVITGKEEGFVSSLYQKVGDRWTWRADEGGAPNACLFRGADVPTNIQTQLEDEMVAANREYPLRPNLQGGTCRYRP
jgi:hypothetical protein